MKQFYTLLTMLCVAFIATAQDSSLSVCNHPDGGVQFTFDYSKGCANAPGDLSGQTEIGFHSGVNSWATAIAWDAAGALTATNDGNDHFTVHISDPAAYYSEANITEYNFVFNQGPENSSEPWASEGKADDGNGGCTDFIVNVADITETCVLDEAPVVQACNDPSGGIQIHFDYAENCENAPGSLSGQMEIGFHSGVNSWASAVSWDAAEAVTGENDGDDMFIVYLADPSDYYGESSITEYNFVFNQGPENSSEPWASEGKADDGNGGCTDFKIMAADITETCEFTVSTFSPSLDQQVSIFPNPLSETTTVSFGQGAGERFTISLLSIAGTVVSTESNVATSGYQLDASSLESGVYFLNIQNELGELAVKKIIIQ